MLKESICEKGIFERKSGRTEGPGYAETLGK
jgi:hypothetical protein